MNDKSFQEDTTSIFENTNVKFGYASNFSSFKPSSFTKQTIVFSGDESTSDVTPTLKKVNNIAEFKSLFGSVSPVDGDGIQYPPQINTSSKAVSESSSKKEPNGQLNDAISYHLYDAAKAYTFGDVSKVAGYVPMINEVMFPINIAYFSFDGDLIADREFSMTGTDPIVLNVRKLSFQSGGNIKADTELKIACDELFKSA